MDDFLFKNTVFIISTRSEAEGMVILAEGRPIEYCIYTEYIDYTADETYEIVKRILKGVTINHFYKVKIYFYPTTVQKGRMLQCIRQCEYDRKVIEDLNQDKFNGELFSGKYNLVTLNKNPLVSLSNYPKDKVYIMEHAPHDSEKRRRIRHKENHPEARLSFGQKVIKGIRNPKMIRNKILSKVVSGRYPGYSELQQISRGFGWINDPADTYQYLDPRKFEFQGSFSSLKDELDGQKKTLLLIDHPAMFQDVPDIYMDIKKVDHVRAYTEYVKRSCHRDDVIIVKPHPGIFEIMTRNEIDIYIDSIRQSLSEAGYEKFYVFEQFFEDRYEAAMPVEIFVLPLGINRIIATLSSVIEITQDWDGIEVIADVRYFKFAQDAIADKRRFGEPVHFKVVSK